MLRRDIPRFHFRLVNAKRTFDPAYHYALQKLDRYLLTEHSLGSGTFGTVRVAVDDLMHRQVACKTVFTGNEGKPAAIQAKRALVMKEVRILESLRHVRVSFVEPR